MKRGLAEIRIKFNRKGHKVFAKDAKNVKISIMLSEVGNCAFGI